MTNGISNIYGSAKVFQHDRFASMIESKLLQLVLRCSFGFAKSGRTGPASKLRQLRGTSAKGTIARAKSGSDASSELRFQKRSVLDFTAKCVFRAIERFQELRQESCNGMDDFERNATVLDIFSWKISDSTRVPATAWTLSRALATVAPRLSMGRTRLALHSVAQLVVVPFANRRGWHIDWPCFSVGTFCVST
ncbi:hypothetical protein CEK25_003360 [Fusarium fujikuroi]|nr:hypothetical protein CEK25_003360 [Fusarium fujikuroi]